MSLSLVDFSTTVQGTVFHSLLLNGDVALCLIANKNYMATVISIRLTILFEGLLRTIFIRLSTKSW
jgi:hypothetical protein